MEVLNGAITAHNPPEGGLRIEMVGCMTPKAGFRLPVAGHPKAYRYALDIVG